MSRRPVVCRWLARLLPLSHRAIVMAHLDHEFDARLAHEGLPAARRWLLRHAIMSMPGALQLRFRDLGRGTTADVRHGLRWLRRHPGFAAGVTCTVALGVGATNAVATLAAAVLVRPLPYTDPGQLVAVQEFDRSRETSSGNVSWPDYVGYERRNNSLELMAGYTGGSRTLAIDGGAVERIPIASVTPTFFSVLGVPPMQGRLFERADGNADGPLVAILTHRTWRVRFGGDPSIVGQSITLNGVRVPVVGILPSTFEFPLRGRAEVFLPVRPSAAQRERQFFHWMDVIARLKPGVTPSQAEADLDAIARTYAEVDSNHANAGVRVVTLRDHIVREAKPVVIVLTSAAGLVLLVACANLAGLLVARSSTRQVEMRVRQSLGASRRQLVRQLLVETLVLAAPGGLLGLVAGHVALTAFVAALPEAQRASLPHLAAIGLDPWTVAATVLFVSVVVMLFAVYPAWRTAAADGQLNRRGVVGRSPADGRAQRVLVGAQIALALTLLTAAGLMTQSVRRLLDVSPGFDATNVLRFTINLSGPRYPDGASVLRFFADATTNIGAIPGVLAVTAIDQAPLSGQGNSGGFTTLGDPGATEHHTLVRSVHPDFFSAMGIGLDAGRLLDDRDVPGAPRAVVINRQLADRAFGGDAIGRRLTFPWSGPTPLEIVGVVGDVQFDSVDQPAQPALYFPVAQSVSGAMDLLVRTAGDPRALLPTIRTRIAKLDPTQALYDIATFAELVDGSATVVRRRLVMLILSGFALSTLALCSVGLFAVLAQVVGERTPEIGVRKALGARGAQVVGSVMRGLGPVLALGLVAGIGGAWALTGLLRSLLFGVAPGDPMTIGAVLVVSTLFLAGACLIPLRRALLVDPMTAMRSDGA